MFNTMMPRNASAAGPWSTVREASLNWLALGLLLAAWNASDNDAAGQASGGSAPEARERPEALRGYAYVSVRAAHRAHGAAR